MKLLLDIGNTHTHLGLAGANGVVRQRNIPTIAWKKGQATPLIKRFMGAVALEQIVICSVVPWASSAATRALKRAFSLDVLVLNHKTVRGIGIEYPKPQTIGPDRLANAVAVKARHGAPSVVVDFGTAVTFDVVNRAGNYIGGIIAPGLSVMTDYLHEKTALLPAIRIRDIDAVVGKSTEEAMLIGAVHGYAGLVRELVSELKRELGAAQLPVVATGGYARLIASRLSEITEVEPLLTLEGLFLFAQLSNDDTG
jgi:type III pantothenate kinase